MKDPTCAFYVAGRYCGATPAGHFLEGWRCSDHTPKARATGVPEPIQPRITTADLEARLGPVRRRPMTWTPERRTTVADARRDMPKVGTHRRKVFDAILDAYSNGHNGATDPELQRHLRLSPGAEAAHREALSIAGLVYATSYRRNGDVVWSPTRQALLADGRED